MTIMKFSSRKDILFSVAILGTSFGLMLSVILVFIKGEIKTGEFWIPPILLLVALFLLWLFFGTSYELTKNELIYRSGPFTGKISLDRIKEVIKGRTHWVGYRPATATKGLIIKYDKFDEIYISPKTNESFISKLLELKSDIKISDRY